jgi:hypothetical protein
MPTELALAATPGQIVSSGIIAALRMPSPSI